jgi:hypothetical protein
MSESDTLHKSKMATRKVMAKEKVVQHLVRLRALWDMGSDAP